MILLTILLACNKISNHSNSSHPYLFFTLLRFTLESTSFDFIKLCEISLKIATNLIVICNGYSMQNVEDVKFYFVTKLIFQEWCKPSKLF